MLCVKPNDGLHVRFVDVSAFMLDLLMYQPSCRKCGCRSSCQRFSWHSLHFYLVTRVQSPLFFAVWIGGGVKPCQKVASIACRAISTWTVIGIARWGVPTLTVVVSRLWNQFYVLNLWTWNSVRVVCNILWISDKFGHLWYVNVVCDIYSWFLVCDIYALLFIWKNKEQKRIFRGGAFPSALAAALGKEGFLKKQISLPSATV
jgi:hypothetical protein